MAKKILIIEDEKPMARALQLKLEKEGFEVENAYDGIEGLNKIENNKYDLIVSDLVVSKLDGFEIIKSIRDQGIETPIIVTSNLSQSEDEKKVLDLGANKYFIKSNTPIVEIIENIKNFLK
jgi:DNA-binding response OmpR family regulator